MDRSGRVIGVDRAAPTNKGHTLPTLSLNTEFITRSGTPVRSTCVACLVGGGGGSAIPMACQFGGVPGAAGEASSLSSPSDASPSFSSPPGVAAAAAEAADAAAWRMKGKEALWLLLMLRVLLLMPPRHDMDEVGLRGELSWVVVSSTGAYWAQDRINESSIRPTGQRARQQAEC